MTSSFQADRDVFVAQRDLHVHVPAGSAAPQPGLFSLHPPYSRLPRKIHGRDDITAELAQFVQQSGHPIQVIHGLGGCGKTTLALSAAQQAQDTGITVWWLDGAHQATLTTQFRHLMIELGADRQLVEAAWQGELSAPDLLWQHLSAVPGRWLLVVDEADEPLSLAIKRGLPADGTGWLRPSTRGTVLVTSRDGNAEVWAGADIHTIRELTAEQAAEVLLEQIDPATVPQRDTRLTAAATALAETLGGLPLALRLAGSSVQAKLRREVRRRGKAADLLGLAASVVADYRTAIQRNVGLLDQHASVGGRLGQEATAKTRVMATWESSLTQLDRRDLPEARGLLAILSCFASAPVPLDMLDSAVLSSSAVFSDTFDDARRDVVLEALADLALVEERPVEVFGGSISCVHVHRLVLETVAAQSSADPEFRHSLWTVAASAVAQAAQNSPSDPGSRPRWALTAPHCLAVVRHCPPLPDPVTSVLSFVQPAQDFLRRQALHQQLLALTEQALDLCQTVFGPEDPRTLECRHNWIRALIRAGQGRNALAEDKSLWLTRARVLGPDHPDTLDSRARYAERLMLSGQVAEAEAEQAAVLATRTRVLGPDHAATFAIRSEYAITLRHLGRWREAAAAHRSILTDRERVLGPDHASTLATRNNLAFTLDVMGFWAEAEQLHRATLGTRTRLLGTDYPATLVTKANLALVVCKQGRYGEAEAIDREVLEARNRIFGPEHPTTLISRRHLVTLLDRCGRTEEAETAGREVLALSRKVLADNHPSVLRSQHALAQILCHGGQLAESEDLHRRTLAIRLERGGDEHPDTSRSRYGLAETLTAAGRLAEAEPLLQQVVEVQDRTFGPGHPETLQAATALADVLSARGRITPAEYRTRLTRIHTALRERIGSDHPQTAGVAGKLQAGG